MTKDPTATRKTTYLSPHWPDWARYGSPPVFYQAPSVIVEKDRSWTAELPTAALEDVTLAVSGGGRLSVEIDGTEIDQIALSDIAAARPKRWHEHCAVSYRLPAGAQRIRIRALTNEAILFHGAFVTQVPAVMTE